MCFYIPTDGKEMTATEDITCYKMGRRSHSDGFVSSIKEYEYGDNEWKIDLVPRRIASGFTSTGSAFIDEGYHSYISFGRMVEELGRNKSGLSRTGWSIKEEFAVFVIPKGAAYYENAFDNERVSSRIRFVRFETCWSRWRRCIAKMWRTTRRETYGFLERTLPFSL